MKDHLSKVFLAEELLLLISRICTELHVGSLRADITLYKTVVALTAWEGGLKVVAEDIRQLAKWVLAHRRRQQPFAAPMEGPDTNDLLNDPTNSMSQDQNDKLRPTKNELTPTLLCFWRPVVICSLWKRASKLDIRSSLVKRDRLLKMLPSSDLL